ncbi:DUF6493 family protein [Saccharopolyspora sp. 7B]|uniref:DUF6493 family protein n=1 Tax=Saccharopolyspora sp. 7B TaxID=2877240 RepID=UPI001CD26113|nr:DUF6493 family protein [Saccharopolyspora sp. 7B]MCA1278331.1 DUF6493 family protein [Saccharopolyspora sp. 7B]
MTLLELVEAADCDGVIEALPGLPPEERDAECGERLFAARRARSDEWTFAQEWAWLAATLGCAISPAEAAEQLIRFRGTATDRSGQLSGAVDVHPVAWRIELVARIRDAVPDEGYSCCFRLVEHIARGTGAPMPDRDVFLRAWLFNHFGHYRHVGSSRFDPADVERLRADPLTPVFLPLALERPGVPVRSWLLPFVQLAEDGLLERRALLRRVVAEVRQDGEVPFGHAQEWELLAPTREERAELADDLAAIVEAQLTRLHQDGTRKTTEPTRDYLRVLLADPADNVRYVRDHLALLDKSLPVAALAQEQLVEVDRVEPLEPELVSDASARILLREEKKLVRTQLSWLDRLAKGDPARAHRVVLDAALAFDNRDVVLQERALHVIARHLRSAGDDVLPRLRTSAARLHASLAPRAAEVLGSEEAGGTCVEALPPAPRPEPVPGPIETVVEVAQEVAVAIADDWEPIGFERALDGVVRHAALDRAGLTEALRPVARKEPRGLFGQGPYLFDVVRTLRGDEPREFALTGAIWNRYRRDEAVLSPPESMLDARMLEVLRIVESGSQPFLLATPTWSTGALDADVLVERIAAFEELGVVAAEHDFAQALLRVDPAPGERVVRTAEALRSEPGRRLARWLRGGGLPHQDSTPAGWAEPAAHRDALCRPAHPGPGIELPLPPAAADLVGDAQRERVRCGLDPFWLAQLPHHRDEVVARDINTAFVRGWGNERFLPHLAAAGGPAGFAVHRLLAGEIGSCRPALRDLVLDSFLVLAARGQLDTGLLGEQLGAMLSGGRMKVSDVHATLQAAADTGAYRTTWCVLAAALPGLLGGDIPRDSARLLALATECAARCGATGEIPAVAEVAARKGSTQLVKSARALRDALA